MTDFSPKGSESSRAESAGEFIVRRRVLIVVLAVTVGVVLFYKLGTFRTLGSHEVFAAVPAREMLNTGNWTVPRFGGLPRLEKPPLAYWVVASASSLFGEVSEWSVRLPAAVSAVLLAMLVGVWAGRWYGAAAGLAAAFAQATSLWVIIFARKAEVDMFLCLLTTAAMFLIVEQRPDETRRHSFYRWIGVYALLALAWMAKFHYGPTMVLAPTLLYFFVQRRYRSVLHLLNPVGLAFVAAAVFIWPYLLLQEVPNAWTVWRVETVGRAVGTLGNNPIWFYIPHLLWMTLPWTPFALAAVPGSWRRAWLAGDKRERHFGISLWKEGCHRERFLWIWFLTVFAIVSLSAGKHKHYIIAALPVVSLLAGGSMARSAAWLGRGQWRLQLRSAIGFTLLWTTASIGAAFAVRNTWPTLGQPALVVGAIAAVGGSLVIWLLRSNRPVPAAYAGLCVSLAAYVGVTGWIIPGRDHRLPTARFAQEVRGMLQTSEPVGVYRMGMRPVVYYLDEPVYRIESPKAVSKRLARDKRLLLVSYAPVARELEKLGETRILRESGTGSGARKIKHDPLVLVELTAADTGLAETGSLRKKNRKDSPRPKFRVGSSNQADGPERR